MMQSPSHSVVGVLSLCSFAAGFLWGCAGNGGLKRRPLPVPLSPQSPSLLSRSSSRVAASPQAKSRESSQTTGSEMRTFDSGPLTLSVEDAILYALRNNRDLRIRQLTTDVQGAFAQIARGPYDTELFAGFQLGHARSEETARSTEERFEVQGSDASSVIGIGQQISSGTAVRATIEHDFSESNRTPEQQRVRVGLTVTQALLQGFGPSVNLAAVEQADLEVQASLYELRGYTEAILAETEEAYWQYVLAQGQIAIYEESLEVTRRQNDEIRQEIEVGTLAEIEAAAARAEVALREQELIDARSALQQMRLHLLRLVGADLGRALVVTSDPSIAPKPIDDLAKRLKLAVRFRAEINEGLLRLEEKRLQTVVTRNGLLPRLDLFVTLGKTGYAENFPNSFKELGADTFDALGGLNLSYMIQGNAARGAHRAAVASHRQATEALDNLRQLTQLEVRLAVNEVERARQQIAASATTRGLQEQKVAAEEERFRVGEGTALLLAQAQRDLLSSRIAEIKAFVDYRIALVQLYRAEGTLLERRGIRLGR